MKTLISILACVVLAPFAPGQLSGDVTGPGVVDGLLTIESSQVTKKLVGKAPVMRGVIRLVNNTGQTVKLPPELVYIAMPNVASMSAYDAQALMTKAYGNQTAQRTVTMIQAGTGALGMAVGGGGFVSIGTKTLGWLLGAVGITDQFVIPALGLNQPKLTDILSNSLDTGGPITLAPGDAITRMIYVQPPEKGQTLQATVHFQFEPGTVGPVGPQPPPPVVSLKPRRTTLNSPPVRPLPRAVPPAPAPVLPTPPAPVVVTAEPDLHNSGDVALSGLQASLQSFDDPSLELRAYRLEKILETRGIHLNNRELAHAVILEDTLSQGVTQ